MSAVPILRSLHLAAAPVLRSAGFRWEVRARGDLKLGMWRKSLREKPKTKGKVSRLVIIPGFGDTSLSWAGGAIALIPLVRARYDELIIFDFPGFAGFLSREKPYHSMELFMSAAFDALDSLKPRAIVGHSLGGWLGGYYAGLTGSGERPSGKAKGGYSGPECVVLIAPSGVFASPRVRERWQRKFMLARDRGFKHLRPHVFGREPSWFRWLVAEFGAFLSRDEIRQFMDSVTDEHLVDRLLPSVRGRVWLVWGEHDSLIEPVNARAWLDRLPVRDPPSRAVEIIGAGHSPHVEKTAATLALLAQLLRGGEPHRLGSRWWRVL
jgi:pimeloyl-ACP methyl ester carboxylesterase